MGLSMLAWRHHACFANRDARSTPQPTLGLIDKLIPPLMFRPSLEHDHDHDHEYILIDCVRLHNALKVSVVWLAVTS